MTEIKVEKNVPRPTTTNRRARYPFATMEVNDSFFMDSTTDYHSVGNSAYVYGKRHGKKFIYRKDETGGVRVWRIA